MLDGGTAVEEKALSDAASRRECWAKTFHYPSNIYFVPSSNLPNCIGSSSLPSSHRCPNLGIRSSRCDVLHKLHGLFPGVSFRVLFAFLYSVSASRVKRLETVQTGICLCPVTRTIYVKDKIINMCTVSSCTSWDHHECI